MFDRKKRHKINKLKCFESKLAEMILNNPRAFPAVGKLSNIIIDLLKRNKKFLLTSDLFKDGKIQGELFSRTHFGKLGSELSECINAETLLDKIIESLQKRESNTPLVMHLHQIFMQKIFEILPDKEIIRDDKDINSDEPKTLSQNIADRLFKNECWAKLKKEVAGKIFSNELFTQPVRIAKDKIGELTRQIGIFGKTKCAITSQTEEHQSGSDQFKPHPNSTWAAWVNEKGLPFVAGPSGHTGSSLLLATLAGNFNREESKEYFSALVGLLTGGGYHSIHEMTAIAEKIGLLYDASSGNYTHFLPESLLQTQDYQTLAQQYPEYLTLPPSASPIAAIGNSFFADMISNLGNYSVQALAPFAIQYVAEMLQSYLVGMLGNSEQNLFLPNVPAAEPNSSLSFRP